MSESRLVAVGSLLRRAGALREVIEIKNGAAICRPYGRLGRSGFAPAKKTGPITRVPLSGGRPSRGSGAWLVGTDFKAIRAEGSLFPKSPKPVELGAILKTASRLREVTSIDGDTATCRAYGTVTKAAQSYTQAARPTESVVALKNGYPVSPSTYRVEVNAPVLPAASVGAVRRCHQPLCAGCIVRTDTGFFVVEELGKRYSTLRSLLNRRNGKLLVTANTHYSTVPTAELNVDGQYQHVEINGIASVPLWADQQASEHTPKSPA